MLLEGEQRCRGLHGRRDRESHDLAEQLDHEWRGHSPQQLKKNEGAQLLSSLSPLALAACGEAWSWTKEEDDRKGQGCASLL